MLRIDHLVYAVRDLDEAAERWWREHGLGSAVGGRHTGWGTANRIVPLGGGYVELISVVDPAEARQTSFGRSMLERPDAGEGWFMIVASTDDLDAIAGRLDLEVTPGERRRLDGETIRWRAAGFEDPRREPWMPFFIAWDIPPSSIRGARPPITDRGREASLGSRWRVTRPGCVTGSAGRACRSAWWTVVRPGSRPRPSRPPTANP